MFIIQVLFVSQLTKWVIVSSECGINYLVKGQKKVADPRREFCLKILYAEIK
jgi:hypothetical protein